MNLDLITFESLMLHLSKKVYILDCRYMFSLLMLASRVAKNILW